MAEFQARRVTHEYTQRNDASPERVFPLLCPVREIDWVPGWRYRLIYSQSGVAELGCVFATPNDDGSETFWVVSDYDPAAFRIAFVWLWHGIATCHLRIQLQACDEQKTSALIRYTYTGLSAKGNEVVAHYSREWFESKMKGWEAAINHYLRTGQKLSAEPWG